MVLANSGSGDLGFQVSSQSQLDLGERLTQLGLSILARGIGNQGTAETGKWTGTQIISLSSSLSTCLGQGFSWEALSWFKKAALVENNLNIYQQELTKSWDIYIMEYHATSWKEWNFLWTDHLWEWSPRYIVRDECKVQYRSDSTALFVQQERKNITYA